MTRIIVAVALLACVSAASAKEPVCHGKTGGAQASRQVDFPCPKK